VLLKNSRRFALDRSRLKRSGSDRRQRRRRCHAARQLQRHPSHPMTILQGIKEAAARDRGGHCGAGCPAGIEREIRPLRTRPGSRPAFELAGPPMRSSTSAASTPSWRARRWRSTMKVSAAATAPGSHCLPCKPRSSRAIGRRTGPTGCLRQLQWERDSNALGSCESAGDSPRPGYPGQAGRHRGGARAFRRLQPVGTASRHLLSGDHRFAGFLRTTRWPTAPTDLTGQPLVPVPDMDSATPNSIYGTAKPARGSFAGSRRRNRESGTDQRAAATGTRSCRSIVSALARRIRNCRGNAFAAFQRVSLHAGQRLTRDALFSRRQPPGIGIRETKAYGRRCWRLRASRRGIVGRPPPDGHDSHRNVAIQLLQGRSAVNREKRNRKIGNPGLRPVPLCGANLGPRAWRQPLHSRQLGGAASDELPARIFHSLLPSPQ